MPTYKLTYFNGKGRAETTRLVFAAAGIKYEDKRVEKADWGALKPSRNLVHKLTRARDMFSGTKIFVLHMNNL